MAISTADTSSMESTSGITGADRRVDSIDAYMSMDRDTSKQVHLQILQGDITKENTQAVVVFRSTDNDGNMVEGESMILLLAAGASIDAEYKNSKAEGGRNVAKGVVLTGAGDLEYRQNILHLHVSDSIPKFRETIFAALRLAEKKELKSISFPSLPDEFDSEERKNILLETLNEFIEEDHPLCLHFIQLVTSQRVDLFKQLFHNNPVLESFAVTNWGNSEQDSSLHLYQDIVQTQFA